MSTHMCMHMSIDTSTLTPTLMPTLMSPHMPTHMSTHMSVHMSTHACLSTKFYVKVGQKCPCPHTCLMTRPNTRPHRYLYTHIGPAHQSVTKIYGYGLYKHDLYSYGPHSYGLYSYGRRPRTSLVNGAGVSEDHAAARQQQLRRVLEKPCGAWLPWFPIPPENMASTIIKRISKALFLVKPRPSLGHPRRVPAAHDQVPVAQGRVLDPTSARQSTTAGLERLLHMLRYSTRPHIPQPAGGLPSVLDIPLPPSFLMPYRFCMRYPRLRADIFGLRLRANIFGAGLAPSDAAAAGPFPLFLHAYASWLMHGVHDTAS